MPGSVPCGSAIKVPNGGMTDSESNNRGDSVTHELICPGCKQPLEREAQGFSCLRCGAIYPEIAGIPILLPPNESTFKSLEREYWDKRHAKESEIAALQAVYAAANFSDDWDTLSYMQELMATIPPPATVLEVGAGLSSQGIPLALAHGYEVVVTDIAVASLAANRQAVAAITASPSLTYYAVDADYLPFAEESFDIVLLHATLHHLPTPKNTIRELVRCLRPGGLLVLGHEPADEGPVLLGDVLAQLGLELLGGQVVDAHALVLGRDDQVDPVGPVTDVLVQPGQLGLQLVGLEADRPQDSQTSGVGHGRGHVAAVGESEDRELDPEAVADLGAHVGHSPSASVTVSVAVTTC
jgi:SAM-dependent methyltransferase